jgi:hypothetical protein
VIDEYVDAILVGVAPFAADEGAVIDGLGDDWPVPRDLDREAVLLLGSILAGEVRR